MTDDRTPAAYGGAGYVPRPGTLGSELGTIWAACGVDSEWSELRAVLMHRPGEELRRSADPDRVLMLAPLDPARARDQHDRLADAYRKAGVEVHLVHPAGPAAGLPPNLMFVADLLFMTPEGAILGRPAPAARAGEERHVARRLAELGMPILRTVRGGGTFEGADAAFLDPRTVLLARGLRTNAEGASQVAATLEELGIRTIQVDLPAGCMHLMGQLRFLDRGLAIGWPGRLPPDALEALRARGFEVLFMPAEAELETGMAMNFVTLGPGRVLMPEGNPESLAFLEKHGATCQTVPVDELAKAAGGIGCLTGILERRPAG